MKITCTKLEAASRQLDEAVALLFADRDPLAIRTLAAAAHGVLSDLVETKRAGQSWRTALFESSGLSRKDALEVLNGAQNFLKHADRDPDATLSFDEEENDYLLFFATLEVSELGHATSTSMQAFQVWFIACYPNLVGSDSAIHKNAASAFDDLGGKTRLERLAAGAEFLRNLPDKYGA